VLPVLHPLEDRFYGDKSLTVLAFYRDTAAGCSRQIFDNPVERLGVNSVSSFILVFLAALIYFVVKSSVFRVADLPCRSLQNLLGLLIVTPIFCLSSIRSHQSSVIHCSFRDSFLHPSTISALSLTVSWKSFHCSEKSFACCRTANLLLMST